MYQRKISSHHVITLEVARRIAAISSEIRRQVGIMVDRRGKVTHVIIGDHQGLFIPDLSGYRSSATRLRGLRLMHTHLKQEVITEDDLTDLSLLHLDLIAAIAVEKGGFPGKVFMAHLLPENVSHEQWSLMEYSHPSHISLDFLQLINSLEEEFDRKQQSLKFAGAGERAILVSVSSKSVPETEESLNELEDLARSGNLKVLDRIVQYRSQVDSRHLLGSGKIREVVIRSLQLGASLLIFDCNLNPSQIKSLTDRIEIKVIDRTQLILDIFAQRAKSKEGKVQVELAQMKYLLPRLATKNTAMSRLTGGIGGRGPGETKLEINRRRVRDRISRLEKEIRLLQRRRGVKRKKRRKEGIPIISIVGYTNAGKSTLLNTLTRSEVNVGNRLFATLDPASRRLRFPRDTEAIITDTVGFIRDLPQDLINAFRATLEELSEADLLLHLIDISNINFEKQMEACEKILSDLEIDRIPRIRVFNKEDVFSDKVALKKLCQRYDAISVSAIKPDTLIGLTERVETFFLKQKVSKTALMQDKSLVQR